MLSSCHAGSSLARRWLVTELTAAGIRNRTADKRLNGVLDEARLNRAAFSRVHRAHSSPQSDPAIEGDEPLFQTCAFEPAAGKTRKREEEAGSADDEGEGRSSGKAPRDAGASNTAMHHARRARERFS